VESPQKLSAWSGDSVHRPLWVFAGRFVCPVCEHVFFPCTDRTFLLWILAERNQQVSDTRVQAP